MTSFVDIDDGISTEYDIKELLDKLLTAVMDHEKCPYEASVNLLVTYADEVHRINLEYRNIDSTTDVLSFPALEFESAGCFDYAETNESDAFDPETGELLLGDIVINIDRVRSQAVEYGHSEYREFAFLVTHSLLHLCGYDHMEENEAVIMEKNQKEILQGLGITRE